MIPITVTIIVSCSDPIPEPAIEQLIHTHFGYSRPQLQIADIYPVRDDVIRFVLTYSAGWLTISDFLDPALRGIAHHLHNVYGAWRVSHTWERSDLDDNPSTTYVTSTILHWNR